MSDAIKSAAARIKEDALNLAERARNEAAGAFKSTQKEREELIAKASETAKMAGDVIVENARIATDLAKRNADAAVSMIGDNARTLTNEMGPIRERAEELAHNAAERLSIAARELSEKVSENSRLAARQAQAHPILALGLAAGGIALLAAAIALSRRNRQAAAEPADENSDYVDPSAAAAAPAARTKPYAVN
jgi:hypothetical protein